MFTAEGLTKGTWTQALKGGLPSNLVPGWKPTIRLWRGDWVRWIQYEPVGWPGPKFWLAKPAIVTFSPDALLVGLYVERGYDPSGAPARAMEQGTVMDSAWQWHGVQALWASVEGRRVFHARISGLAEPVASVEHSRDRDSTVEPMVRLSDASAYDRLRQVIEAVPGTRFVNLVIGIAIPFARCAAKGVGVVEECRTPLVRAWELHELIKKAMPHR